MNRKAEISIALVTVVIFAIVFMLLLVLGPRLWSAATGIGDQGACATEAVQKDFRDTLSDKLGGFWANTNIYLQNCPANVKYVTKEKYKSEEEVNKLFADEAVRCFNQFNDFDIFPSGEKIPSARGMETAGRWEKALAWLDGDRIILQNGELTSKSVYAPPVYCAICSKITFDEEYREDYKNKDELPMFTQTLKNQKTKLQSSSDNNYDHIDKGRFKGKTAVDTLERYSYDPSKTNVILYYRKYSYEYTLGNWETIYETLTLNRQKSQWFNYWGEKIKELVNGETDYATKEVKILKRSDKAAAIPRINEAYSDASIANQVGLFSYLSAQSELGLYKFFSYPKDGNEHDEYGVASVPYEYVAHQCDFVANGYGTVRK